MTDFNMYYMLVALAVSKRANCLGRKVGAIIVKDNRIIATGYNGTPEGMTNCEDGGCIRCKNYREIGKLYDKCICVHAEQNAMITSARFGHSMQDSIIYTTLQPCFSCTKEFLQAKVKTVYYLDPLEKKSNPKKRKEEDRDFDEQYKILFTRFDKFPTQLDKKLLIKEINALKKYLIFAK